VLPGSVPPAITELLGWIIEHATSPRLVLAIEGTSSYGIGLARAVSAAGLRVIEAEQPHRRQRRGRGKSDPIEAHLAVLIALRLDAGRLPTPRADGDREALRILLGAREELKAPPKPSSATPTTAGADTKQLSPP